MPSNSIKHLSLKIGNSLGATQNPALLFHKWGSWGSGKAEWLFKDYSWLMEEVRWELDFNFIGHGQFIFHQGCGFSAGRRCFFYFLCPVGPLTSSCCCFPCNWILSTGVSTQADGEPGPWTCEAWTRPDHVLFLCPQCPMLDIRCHVWEAELFLTPLQHVCTLILELCM